MGENAERLRRRATRIFTDAVAAGGTATEGQPPDDRNNAAAVRVLLALARVPPADRPDVLALVGRIQAERPAFVDELFARYEAAGGLTLP